MSALLDIVPRLYIAEGFMDANIEILIIGYSKAELKNIVTSKTHLNMIYLFMDGILRLDELILLGKAKLFYGYDKTKFVDDLMLGNSVPKLIQLRLLYKKYGVLYKLDNHASIATGLNYTISELEMLLTGRCLLAEVCKILILGNSLAPLELCLSAHMYKFDPEYIKNNVGLYKYLKYVPFKDRKTVCSSLPSLTVVSEIDMMKKMYGIPFIDCNSERILSCYNKLMEGGLTLTLLVKGNVNATSDITYDEYGSDELIFLLWNRGKFRPYNIPDINACIEGNTIKMVDYYGDILENTMHISKLLLCRIRPYMNDTIREAYRTGGAVNPNDVYPMIIRILDVAQKIVDIDSIPKKLVNYVNVYKEKCKEYLMDMYHMALYFRRWKGPGHPIPYKKLDAEDRTVNPEITSSALIYKYRMLITSGEILPFLKVCPVYKNATIVPEHDSMETTFRTTILGTNCIRVASGRFLHTSHRIYTSLFGNIGSKIEDFENINLYAPEESH